MKANRRKINIGLWRGGYSGFYDRQHLPQCPGCIPAIKLEPEKTPDGKDGWRCPKCGTFSAYEEITPAQKDKTLKPKDTSNSQPLIISQPKKKKTKNVLGNDIDDDEIRAELKSYGVDAADPKDYLAS